LLPFGWELKGCSGTADQHQEGTLVWVQITATATWSRFRLSTA
jgi:hypothetical protein